MPNSPLHSLYKPNIFRSQSPQRSPAKKLQMHSLLPSPSPLVSPPVTRLLLHPKLRHLKTTTTTTLVSATARTSTLVDPNPIKKEDSSTSTDHEHEHDHDRRPPTSTTVDSPSAAYWDYQFLFLSQRSETLTLVDLNPVVGSLPRDFPLGTYYLTGPGLFTDDHGSTVHPLDGHGYLRAFHFGDDDRSSVKYSAKYIKTEAQQEEMMITSCTKQHSIKFTHRGPFSVLRAGRKIGNTKVMKNVANTSVVRWGRRVMCFWEGGEPYEVDEETLETLGTVDLVKGLDRTVVVGETRRGVVERAREGLVDVAANFLKPILQGE